MSDTKPASPQSEHLDHSDAGMNRRSLLKTTAGLGVAAAAVGALPHSGSTPHAAHAQEVDGTRARSWDEADNINTDMKLEGDGWVTLRTEFPFWALGFAWDKAVGTWPAVQFGISNDGNVWDDGHYMTFHSDGGPAPADDRLHTDLFFADGQEYVRYRTLDGEGNLVVLDRFQVTYIDPTDGPWEPDRSDTMMRTTAVNSDTLIPPAIISRAQWGANESLRFDSTGEIWPPEYQTVEHAIVHHAAANYGSDGYNAVRSIYYYHAVTQGWGDIGYNYVVDVNGNIFEGRVGGANVIGGHAFEYANGSSGICVMGDFSSADAPYAAKVALANIIAYVVRDLNPFGTKPFHAAPALPTICAHRDVNQSTCPGDGLYDDLPWIRQTVANTLNNGLLDSQKPGGIVPGDWVRVQTENNTALPMRSQPGMNQLVIDYIPYNTRIEVERGPLTDSQFNWYLVHYNRKTGWVPADYLVVSPPIDEPTDGYSYGQNLRVTATTSMRSTPNGTVSGSVASGAWAFIMAGPLSAGGTSWFQIRTQSNGDGWVPRSTITLAPVYNPTPRFPVGSNVVTTVTAPMRVRPGIAQTTDGSVPAGRTLQVSIAPIAVTDRIWYGVYGGTGTGGGWIEEGHLRAGANNIIVVGNVTATGQQFRTKDSVNLRSGPGTGFSIVQMLAAGVVGSVVGGPQSGSGYTWWQVRTDSGLQGWIATDFIEQIKTGTTGTLTGFGVGVTVRTNTSVNMRSDGGTGYPVVATLPANTNGTIIDGPRLSTGYTWWRIRTTTGLLGWVAQTYLVRTSGLPAKFKATDSVRTTQRVTTLTDVNNWNTAGAIDGNQFGAVLRGPQAAHGNTWYLVSFPSGSFWVPDKYLVARLKFALGSSARTTRRTTTLTDVNNWNTAGVIDSNQFGGVMSAPRWAHNHLWYLVRFPNGVFWVPQHYLDGTLKFKVGRSVRTTQRVTTLTDVNNWATAGALDANKFGPVMGGPRWAHNHLWYLVRFPEGLYWIPQQFLTGANKFAVGAGVVTTRRVTFLLDVNNWASAGAVDGGVFGAVMGAPVFAFNLLWYRLNTPNGIGWVPQDYLERRNQFAIGQLAEATQRVVNLETPDGPIDGGALEAGEIVEILDGPVYAGVHIWYYVANTVKDGWTPQRYLKLA